ncbi:MAG: glycine cleavage system aminomethyltransferase GcvT [Bacillota bacterium]
MELKKTPLYQVYEESGGKIVDFGGWALPVQFRGIIEEHQATRQAAGLFDVSHMGEVMIEGPAALGLVQKLITNDAAPMELHQVIYSPMCYPDGGCVDDCLVYKLGDERYFMVVNAANIDKDVAWMQEQAQGMKVMVEDISHHYAELALQGPKAEIILQRLTDFDLGSLRFFYCCPAVVIDGEPCLISRTGYTGEDGFEIYCRPEAGPRLWRAILAAGQPDGLLPAGLGARDTLRFEARLPLYGHEIDRDISPLEAGLGYFIKLDKGDFIGAEALRAQKEAGIPRRLIGLEMVGRGIARAGYPVYADNRQIGQVTSGSYAPSLGKNMALALVERGHGQLGNELTVEIRGKQVEARVVKAPFYAKAYKKE